MSLPLSCFRRASGAARRRTRHCSAPGATPCRATGTFASQPGRGASRSPGPVPAVGAMWRRKSNEAVSCRSMPTSADTASTGSRLPGAALRACLRRRTHQCRAAGSDPDRTAGRLRQRRRRRHHLDRGRRPRPAGLRRTRPPQDQTARRQTVSPHPAGPRPPTGTRPGHLAGTPAKAGAHRHKVAAISDSPA